VYFPASIAESYFSAPQYTTDEPMEKVTNIFKDYIKQIMCA